MNRILAVVALLAAATGVFADTHTWVGGNSSGGGWNVAANWTNEVGEAECPSAGDVALLNRKGETVVANDDDAALFCSLQRVKLDSWADDGCQTLVLDVSTNVLVGCAINGYGTFIKRGDGTATLDSTCRDGMSAAYGYWAVYDLIYGGICVEAGTLVFPQGKDFSYCLRWGGLTVAAGATFSFARSNVTLRSSFSGLTG